MSRSQRAPRWQSRGTPPGTDGFPPGLVLLLVLLAGFSAPGDSLRAQVREASGVARSNGRLLIVGDDAPGVFWEYQLQAADLPRTGVGLLTSITIDREHVTEHQLLLPLALDLEAVEMLADGIVVVLSERVRALLAPGRVIAEYPEPFTEFGARGLEGLAVREENGGSVVPVLWEGGFVEHGDVPGQLGGGDLVKKALQPVVCAHRIGPTAAQGVLEPCKNPQDWIVLRVLVPPDTMQRFRAPDLVWDREGTGFIVLLSSQNATTSDTVEYKYKWLMRFDQRGAPAGHPLSLCDPGMLPPEMQHGLGGNVEGLGWFEFGKSLVLVNDRKGPATAAILAVPEPWPTAASTTDCL